MSAARRSGTSPGRVPRSGFARRRVARTSASAASTATRSGYTTWLSKPVSHAVVDERHEWLVSMGTTIESSPREYSYIPGYYAVFFYDPDGIKLEIVHVPGLAA